MHTWKRDVSCIEKITCRRSRDETRGQKVIPGEEWQGAHGQLVVLWRPSPPRRLRRLWLSCSPRRLHCAPRLEPCRCLSVHRRPQTRPLLPPSRGIRPLLGRLPDPRRPQGYPTCSRHLRPCVYHQLKETLQNPASPRGCSLSWRCRMPHLFPG